MSPTSSSIMAAASDDAHEFMQSDPKSRVANLDQSHSLGKDEFVPELPQRVDTGESVLRSIRKLIDDDRNDFTEEVGNLQGRLKRVRIKPQAHLNPDYSEDDQVGYATQSTADFEV